MDKARVFISWSGSPSKEIAGALREWLPRVFQTLSPFSSDADVRAGDSWFNRISTEVQESHFAIICVTSTNKDSPWLHYEAGAVALAQRQDGAPPPTVMPYRIGVGTVDVEPPLSMFQSVAADEAGTLRLVQAINERVPAPLAPEDLRRTFAKWWPDLDAAISRIVEEADEPEPEPRDEREILEEVLAVVRGLDRAPARPSASAADSSAAPSPTEIASAALEVPGTRFDLKGERVTLDFPADVVDDDRIRIARRVHHLDGVRRVFWYTEDGEGHVLR